MDAGSIAVAGRDMPDHARHRGPRARPRAPRWLLGASALLLLAGCQSFAPNASVPLPPKFRGSRSTPAAAPSQTWVQGFGSGELNRLVTAALAGNLDIEAAIARVNQAEAQVVVASAPLFPFLGGTSDVSRRQLTGNTRSNTFGLGLTASYELDLFGRTRYAVAAADQTAAAVRFDRDTVALSTVALVSNAYFAVLSAQDRLRIAEDNLAIAGRVLDAVRGRLRVGTGTALDTAQQESVVATQRAAIPPLRQTLAQNRNLLAILIGRTPESITVSGGSLDRLRLPEIRPGLPAQLLLRRPDIAREEANLAAAEANIGSARAAFFPSIQLTGSGGFQSAALRSLLGGGSAVYSLASGVTQPILDNGILRGQFAFGQGRAAEFAASYRKAIIQSLVDVENALVAVRETTEYETRQREAVAASRRALDITEQRLREGTVDVVTLFNIQTTLFGNQDALARVRLQRFQAVVSLFQALGGGWSQPRAVVVARSPEPQPLSFDWQLRP